MKKLLLSLALLLSALFVPSLGAQTSKTGRIPEVANVSSITCANIGDLYYQTTAGADGNIGLHECKVASGSPTFITVGWIDVVAYGADPTGATDSTTAIQNAINAGDALNNGTYGVRNCYFPPGRYDINATIIWKACNLITSNVPNSGVQVRWNGLGSIAAPAAATGSTSTTGGTIAAGTYRIAVTYADAYGKETLISNDAASTIVTTGATSTTTVNAPSSATGVLGYRVYVSPAGGAANTEALQTMTATQCTLATGITTGFQGFTACAIGSNWTNGSLAVAGPGVPTVPVNNNAGGVMFFRPVNCLGCSSFGRLDGFYFRQGTATPATGLVIAGTPDKYLQVNNFEVGPTTGDCIQVQGGWFNLHWRDLRFDGCGGYGILAYTFDSQNDSSFQIDGFTWDNASTPASGGVINFDNTRNASAAGVAVVKTGRIEINATQGINKTLFNLKCPPAGANTRWLALKLENLAVDNVVAQTGDSLAYSDCPQGNIGHIIELDNVRLNAVHSVFLGQWYLSSGTFPLPTANVIQHYFASGFNPIVAGDGDPSYECLNIATDRCLAIFQFGDTVNRFNIDSAGTEVWGPGGASAVDVGLKRNGAGALKVTNGGSGDGSFSASAFATATNCAVNSASPAACGSAAAGAFVIPTLTTTYVVNTTAVTAASRIFLQPITFASNLPGTPTCVTPLVGTTDFTISAVSAGTSFTVALQSTTGTVCFEYWIVN